VCALHEHEHTRLEALNKFVKYKFYEIKEPRGGNIFPEGESPLCAEVTLGSISKWSRQLSGG